jgi:hypothetical protein
MRIQYVCENIRVAVAALWLRGAPRAASVASGRWPLVVAELRNGRNLRDGGHWWEAAILEDDALLGWAEAQVEGGRCLTVVDEDYPRRWLSVLRARAPAAVWIDGDRSVLSHSRWLGFTGSRSPTESCRRFVRSVAEEAIGLGFGIVSGGAVGCDRIAAETARRCGGPLVELLPYGLSRSCRSQERMLSVTACALHEDFTSAGAMERNAWIYSFGEATLASQPRLHEGALGTALSAPSAAGWDVCWSWMSAPPLAAPSPLWAPFRCRSRACIRNCSRTRPLSRCCSVWADFVATAGLRTVPTPRGPRPRSGGSVGAAPSPGSLPRVLGQNLRLAPRTAPLDPPHGSGSRGAPTGKKPVGIALPAPRRPRTAR